MLVTAAIMCRVGYRSDYVTRRWQNNYATCWLWLRLCYTLV